MPREIIGSIDLPVRPDGECDVLTEAGIVQVREYYELRKRRPRRMIHALAVKAHG